MSIPDTGMADALPQHPPRCWNGTTHCQLEQFQDDRYRLRTGQFRVAQRAFAHVVNQPIGDIGVLQTQLISQQAVIGAVITGADRV
jgi:hypothetical protein